MRKHRFIDCNPRWSGDGVFVTFDCPEGHKDCTHTIRVDPARGHDHPKPTTTYWYRVGDLFEKMTLTPSVRRIPVYESMAKAVESGWNEADVTPTMLCAMHINIANGVVKFCGDSR